MGAVESVLNEGGRAAMGLGTLDPDQNVIVRGWNNLGEWGEAGFRGLNFTQGRPGASEQVATGDEAADRVNRMPDDIQKGAQAAYGAAKSGVQGYSDFVDSAGAMIMGDSKVPEQTRPFIDKIAKGGTPNRSDVIGALREFNKNPDRFSPEGRKHLQHWMKQYAGRSNR